MILILLKGLALLVAVILSAMLSSAMVGWLSRGWNHSRWWTGLVSFIGWVTWASLTLGGGYALTLSAKSIYGEWSEYRTMQQAAQNKATFKEQYENDQHLILPRPEKGEGPFFNTEGCDDETLVYFNKNYEVSDFLGAHVGVCQKASPKP